MTLRIYSLLLLLLAAEASQIYGVNYGYQRGDGSCSTYQEILADFQIMSQYTNTIRIYTVSACGAGQNVIEAAAQYNMKVLLQVVPTPDSAYQADKSALQSLAAGANFNVVVAVIVGAEDLYRGDTTSSALASQLTDIKQTLTSAGFPGVFVTHADVYYMQPSDVVAASDIITIDAYPYWEGVSINDALSDMQNHISNVQGVANGKPIWIAESGWPTSGATESGAVPSDSNAATFLQQLSQYTNSAGIPLLWFEAFDEPWKGTGVESAWGLYNDDRTPKDYFLTVIGNGGASPQPTSATPQPSTSATPQPSTSATPQPSTSATPQPSTSVTPPPQTSATLTATCNCGGASCCFTSSGTVCYDPSSYSCPGSDSGNGMLCPYGYNSCGGSCYSSSQYCCQNGQLTQISYCPAASVNNNNNNAVSKSTTSSAAATPASSTTSAAPVRVSSTSSSTSSAAASTAPNTGSGGSGAAQCGTNNCGASSCCPDARNGNLCYSSSNYNCVADKNNGKTYLCSSGAESCNGACFDPSAYACSGGSIVQN